METTVALVIVTDAAALMEPELAVIVAVPADTPEARPACTVAIPGEEEVHFTAAVTSFVLPSL